jgi:hypothetical protein
MPVHMKQLFEWILSKEAILFFIFSLLNLYTIFQVGFHYSLDGPQHLYVANIIAELIRGNEEVSRYILVNDLIVGYWTGTFLLAVMKLCLPAAIALKVLLVIYYLSVAYAFRYLVRSVYHKPTLISFLIFPFSATFFIGAGYFNFSLALAVMFLCLGYYIRNIHRLNWQKLLLLSLMLLLQFLTHAFVFAVTGVIMLAYLVFHLFVDLQNSGKPDPVFRKMLKNTGLLFLASLPSNLLFLNYYVSIKDITSHIETQFIPFDSLLEGILDLRNMLWFVKEEHFITNTIIWGILVFLTLYILVSRIRQWYLMKDDEVRPASLLKRDFFFFAGIVFLLFYFFYPDWLITGNISLRILTLFFLLFLVWISSQRYPAWVSVLVMIIIIPLTVAKRNIHMDGVRNLLTVSQRVIDNTSCMEPNSVYVALDYSTAWTHRHLSSLPGMDTPLIYTDAPQVYGQFPLRVNPKDCPKFYVGTKGRDSLQISWSLVGNDSIPIRPVDYVVLIYANLIDDGPEHNIMRDELDRYYHQLNGDEKVVDQVFELNNRELFLEKYAEATSMPAEVIVENGMDPAKYYKQKYLELLNTYCLADTNKVNIQ